MIAEGTATGVEPAPRAWSLGTALNELSSKGCFLFGMCVISVVPDMRVCVSGLKKQASRDISQLSLHPGPRAAARGVGSEEQV